MHVHLHLCQHYVLVPYAADTLTKFARQGELYARLDLRDELSEDTKHGRLILENVTSVTLTFTHQTRVSDILDMFKPLQGLLSTTTSMACSFFE